MQPKEHPERAGVIDTCLHACAGAVLAQDQLSILCEEEAQDISRVERRGHLAHSPEFLAVHQLLWVWGKLHWAQCGGVTRGHTIGQWAWASQAWLAHCDVDGLWEAQWTLGEYQCAFFFVPMTAACHCLLIHGFKVAAPQLMETQLAFQGSWEERVQRILWNGAGAGDGCGWEAESCLVSCQVEVTEADGQAGGLCLTSQGWGASYCSEGTWTETVWRDDLTIWEWEEQNRTSKVKKESLGQIHASGLWVQFYI